MTTRKSAVFILTHGRPDKVQTYNTLRKHGYTGDIYVIIDDEDKTADRYRELYGDQVVIFDKAAAAKTFDEAGQFADRRAVVYARNASFDIAADLGLTHFWQFDDDYVGFNWRFSPDLIPLNTAKRTQIKNLDQVFSLLMDYFDSIDCHSLAMLQSGDFVGGLKSSAVQDLRLRRKAMNTFLCRVDRPFKFQGRINEDVNTYVGLGHTGHLFLSVNQVYIHQGTTQQSEGGMTDLYLNSGTYIKSFYTVLFAPSCTKVFPMGYLYPRLHHKVTWRHAVPHIIRADYRKEKAV
jgi:hypothetical protein